MEACWRVEATEAKVECLKGALSKAEVNLASENERREVEATKAKKRLVETEERATKAKEVEERSIKVERSRLWLNLLQRRPKWWRPSRCPRNFLTTASSLAKMPFARVIG